jgi:hypothetical protein
MGTRFVFHEETGDMEIITSNVGWCACCAGVVGTLSEFCVRSFWNCDLQSVGLNKRLRGAFC